MLNARYARILHLGPLERSEVGPMGRFLEVLRSKGHVVQSFDVTGDPDGLGLARRMINAFGPDLLLWNGFNIEAGMLGQLSCPAIPVTLQGKDGAWQLGAFLDEDYRLARIADPNVTRDHICIMQPRCEVRARQVASVLHEEKLDGMVALDDSWSDHSCHELSYASLPYWCRRARYSVIFVATEDEIAPTAADLVLRMEEGSLLLVEEGVDVPRWLSHVSVDFAQGQLAEVIRELEGNPLRYKTALKAQQAALNTLPSSDTMVGYLLSYAAKERGFLGSLRNPALKVLVYGWFGARNFGDDLLLELVHSRVRECYPSAQILVIGADPRQIQAQHGLQATEPHQKRRICEWLDGAAALIFCGGLMFDDALGQTAGEPELVFDPWIDPAGQAAICFLARMYDVPMYFLGIGAGPMETPAMQRCARLMGAVGARFLTRDRETSDLLRTSGVCPDQIHTCADLAFGSLHYVGCHTATMEVDPARKWLLEQSRPYLVVSLRNWHLNPSNLALRIAQALDSVCDERDVSVLLLPLDEGDVDLHGQVRDLMVHKRRVFHIGERPNLETTLGHMTASSAALAMRLHCSLLHMVLGKPAVGLDYNDKVSAQFRVVGQERRLLPLNAPSDRISAAVISALDTSESFAGEVAGAIARQKALVDAGFNELFAAIDAAVAHGAEAVRVRTYCYPRIVSLTEQELARTRMRTKELEASVMTLERERDTAIGELTATRDSTSYRLGNIMAGPIAAIKRRFSRRR